MGKEQLHVGVRRGAHVLLSSTDEELSAVAGEVADSGSPTRP